MPADSSVELQQLIDRFPHEGTEVRRELLERAMDRLRRLTAKILGQSFPALHLIHDVDSVATSFPNFMATAQAIGLQIESCR